MKQRMVSLGLVLLLLLGMLPVQRGLAAETLAEAVISTEGLTHQIASAYLEIVDSLVTENGGYSKGNADDFDFDSGFSGGYLMDLSGDGVPELCVLSRSPGVVVYCDIWTWDGTAPKHLVNDMEGYYGTYYSTLSLHPRDGVYCYDNIGVAHNTSRVNGIPTVSRADSTLFKGIDSFLNKMSDEDREVDHLTADDALMLLRGDLKYGFIPNGEKLRAQLEVASVAGLTATELLEKLTYHGDRSLCKMDAKMAQAYADALAGMPAHYDNGYEQGTLHAALYDIAGDGMPLLLTAYLMDDPSDTDNLMWGEDPALAPSFWTYENGAATRYAFEKDAYARTGSMYIGTWGGETMLAVAEGFLLDIGGYGGTLYYGVKNTQLTLLHSEQCFSVYSIDAATAEGQALPGKKDKDSGSHTIPLEELVAGNWDITYSEESDFFYAYLLLFDGVKQTRHDGGYMPSFFPYEYDKVTRICNLDAYSFMEAAMARASTLMAALTAYAQSAGKPSYTFPAVTDDEALVRAIAEAVAAKLGGEITGIYQLADGLWYVVITVDGTTKGAVVQAVQSGGKLTYEVLDSHDTPAEEEVLQGLANDFQSTPNLSPDYAATEDFTTTKDFLDYLNGLLDYIPGGTPNDAAKGELAAFLENSISRVSTVTVTAQGNRVTLTGGDISAGGTSAKDAADKLLGALTSADVTLNKTLTIIIRIECQGLDSGKPLQLDLDKSLLDTLGDAELMLLLGDSSRAVRITAANLRMLIDAYETLSIQMEKAGDAYTINFLNAKGEIITRLCANVSFLLPATGPLATVLASYEGGSDNWGGQYDARAAAILFSTPYSGTYEVMENDLTISDLEGLSEEQRAAVSFMVSKGYFTLDGADAFRPTEFLTRYDFTKALVGMFFAMEHGLSTTFTDVPADSPYFDAVASAQAKDIVKGYNETTFAGEANISGEQVLTLAGRTLVERKGYSYPADPAGYLTFPGGAEVDAWARDATALAAREGILAHGESLAPLADLSRADAALYLYRLFMLLYETSPEAIQMQTPPEKPAASSTPIIPIVLVTAGVAAAGGGGAWLWLKRKRGV